MTLQRLLILIIACTFGSAAGCECTGSLFDRGAEGPDAGATQTGPVVFESEEAPYSVRLPDGWRLEGEGALNKEADLAASKSNRLFLIVLPQDLPSIQGVDSPGVEELKRTSIERMSENVQQLEIQREGPVTLESADARSVVAKAQTENGEVQYVATYVTRGTWGYQIVAWGPVTEKSELVDSVDAVIKGWQFTSDSLPSPDADAPSADSSEQSFD